MINKKLNLKDKVDSKSVLECFNNGISIFEIPEYQRKYKWSVNGNLKDLAETIEKLVSTSSHSWYLGSITTKKQPNANITLIDGQQRITTIYLFVKALYDINNCLIKNNDINFSLNSVLFTDINNSNASRIKFSGLEKEDELKKLIMQDHDVNNLNLTIDESSSQYAENYVFFVKQIKKWLKERRKKEWDILLLRIFHSLDRLWITTIKLGPLDDDLAIFESINSKGTPLNVVELLKNYLFIKIKDLERNSDHLDRRFIEEANVETRKIFEEDLKEIVNLNIERQKSKENDVIITRFIRTYITYRNSYLKDSGIAKKVKKNDTTQSLYSGFKNIIENSFSNIQNQKNLEEFFFDFNKFITVYKKIGSFYKVNSKEELDVTLSLLNSSLLGNQYFPVVMWGVEWSDWQFNKKGREHLGSIPIEFKNIILLLEALIVKKNIIGQGEISVSNNLINKKFTSLEQLMEELHIQNQLITIEKFKSFLIKNGIKINKKEAIKTLLWRVELFKNKQRRDKIQLVDQDLYTIEHIMPQSAIKKRIVNGETVYSDWLMYIVENDESLSKVSLYEAREVAESYLNTIGNLSLSKDNSKIGNKSFTEKQRHYERSDVIMNRELLNWHKWTIKEIEERSDDLFNICKKIWFDDIDKLQ